MSLYEKRRGFQKGVVNCMIGSKSVMFLPIRPSRKQLDEDVSQE